MPIDERRKEILEAEETVRALAGELASHSTAAKELQDAREAVGAARTELSASIGSLRAEATKVKNLADSLDKRAKNLGDTISTLATTEAVEALAKRMKWALVASGAAAVFALIAVLQSFAKH